MSQPVKLSDGLVLEARIAGAAMQRSIAGQVEFWARLGKSVEGLITGQQMTVLGRDMDVATVLNRLDTVDSVEGRQRVQEYLDHQPFPHYRSHAGGQGLLTRIEEDGRQTTGRFVNREFVAVEQSSNTAAA